MSSNQIRPVSEARRLIVIALLVAVVPFSMEAYLPAMPVIAEHLGVSIVEVNLTISLYLLGGAIGEFFVGAISDQIGRKANVVIGLSVFSLSSIGIVFCNDITTLQILRVFQALGCGFASIVGMPSLRDMFDPETTARKIPIIASVMMIAPMFAPVAGALLMLWDWRAIFGMLAVIGFLVMALYVTTINARKGSIRKFSLKKIITQYAHVLRFKAHGSRVALHYLLIQGFVSGVFLTFLTNAAWIYVGYYEVRPLVLPLFFAIHTGAMLCGNLIISRIVMRVDPRTLIWMGAITQASTLFIILMLNWTGHLSLMLFTLALIPLIFGSALINSSLRALVYSYFNNLTGSMTSLLSLARNTFGAVMGATSALFFNESLLPILGIMAFCAFACLSIIQFMLPNHTLAEISKLEREEHV